MTNLNRVSISSDMVFGDDGGVRELAKIKGSLKKGYRARLLVPVDVDGHDSSARVSGRSHAVPQTNRARAVDTLAE